MLKKLLFIFVFALFFTKAIQPLLAQEENFITEGEITYTFDENGTARVKFETVVINKNADFYAQSYKMDFENITAYDFKVIENGQEPEFTIEEGDSEFSLTTKFNEPAVGEGAKKVFTIEFSVDDFATKTGEIWEIDIPRLNNATTFENFSVWMIVPSELGRESYVSPQPTEKEITPNSYRYLFSREKLSGNSINAGFGDFQVFSFTLNYHLENSTDQDQVYSIPIPPDTNYQKMYYSRLEPKPQNVVKDVDGNWLAEYKIEKDGRIDVTAQGVVRITQSPQFDFKYEPEPHDLDATEYWQKDDPAIIQAAANLTTPKDIYDYVVETLSYDFERAKPGVTRSGAVAALSNPQSAICMEFTDLFIALARAKGIPAREVNGFAYTENPEIQPLSLINDVLHSWPEYYDFDRKMWIPVDPTWGDTTGGADYFNKLDMRHFAFVFHSNDPSIPFPPGSYKLGNNPQKDVFVNFSRLPEESSVSTAAQITLDQLVPFTSTKADVLISNIGQSAVYDQSFDLIFDGKSVHTISLDQVLPFSNHTYTHKVPFSFLGFSTPENISLIQNSVVLSHVPGNKALVITYNTILFFMILGLGCLALYWAYKKYAH